MNQFEARRIIEALRSGVPSIAVGQYFSSARADMMGKIEVELETVIDDQVSNSFLFSGRYGEGKTHLLNSVFNMAHEKNMVVSMVPISKETPLDKLYLIYQKLINNTYLPGRLQPGFSNEFEKMTLNSTIATSLQDYASQSLETKKLLYVFNCYLGTDDYEEKFMLLGDLEGDFIQNSLVKQMYKRIFSESIKEPITFAKSRNVPDYFSFMSQLFLKLGYNGWVILFDEAELIGRLGRKARLNAYKNMAQFLYPCDSECLKSTYTIFAFSSSYPEDVIFGKGDESAVDSAFMEKGERNTIKKVLNHIVKAPQLKPLTNDEMLEIMNKLKYFHGLAYGWNPTLDIPEALSKSVKSGHLLRTKIRTTVELLDQLYQYGKTYGVTVNQAEEAKITEESNDEI